MPEVRGRFHSIAAVQLLKTRSDKAERLAHLMVQHFERHGICDGRSLRAGARRQQLGQWRRLVRERPMGEDTAQIAARLRSGAEGQEGLNAFLERRSPGWRE